MTAAIFALEGYLNWWFVVGVAFAGVVLGDIAWYYLGRYSKETRLGNWLSKKFAHYQGWLSENFTQRYFRLAFISKFLYYINRLTPLLAGWEKMEFKKFFKIHFFAGLLWVIVMFIVGRSFGFVIEIIGVKVVLHRLYWFFAVMAVLVIVGEHFLRKFFIKKIGQ